MSVLCLFRIEQCLTVSAWKSFALAKDSLPVHMYFITSLALHLCDRYCSSVEGDAEDNSNDRSDLNSTAIYFATMSLR
jgi:hypothetical protein